MRLPRRTAACAVFVVSLSLSSCLHPFVLDARFGNDDCPEADDGQPLGLKELSCKVDCFEKHLEKYGSVVPKRADVWGQSRLMMHRHEFEKQMHASLDDFKDSLQGSIARSDQAYLASAFSLSAAVSGGAGGGAGGAQQASDVTTVVSTPQPKPAAPAASPVQAPTPTDPKDLISTPDMVIQRSSSPRVVKSLGFAAADANKGLSIEPTLLLSQKARYLNHLHELRRINEGDDNTDAPGYALNLVRLPVSILTGGCTQKGHGAEITVTATPHLTDDLLPITFRDLVVNDIVDQITLIVVKTIEITPPADLQAVRQERKKARTDKTSGYADVQASASPADTWAAGAQAAAQAATPRTNQLKGTVVRVSGVARSSSRHRAGLLPLPPSQVLDVLGHGLMFGVAAETYNAVRDHLSRNTPYHLDVQKALHEELRAAYAFLELPHNLPLWHFASPEAGLTPSIRSRAITNIQATRNAFFKMIDQLHPDQGVGYSLTGALAWAIIVESALLNEKLLEDMRATHAAKGCACPPAGGLPFYLPDPPAEARQLFNEYVRCRWPLYVFAIDPVTEDQNVADAFSMRRELQLAMALAFTTGQMNARSLSRFTRRLEKDMETIALNRTQVGFSHGDNTFGWRFYPRVQTPPFRSNLGVIFGDLLIGGLDWRYETRNRRLENGQRECIALVVMPSFVPYVNLEVHSNWFRLTNPKCKEETACDVVRLSRHLHRVRAKVQAGGADCVGPEAGMLMSRLNQLGQRLPFQTQLINVPHENTHGGFEMFTAGVTELAPELAGWYGAPGIDTDSDTETSFFLVGNHFSVHQTRVVIGGMALNAYLPDTPVALTAAGQVPDVPQVELLSRQIMRVKIPKQKLVRATGGTVDVHVATPYGTSAALAIPVVAKGATNEGYEVMANANTFTLNYRIQEPTRCDKTFAAEFVSVSAPGYVSIAWEDAIGRAAKSVTFTFAFTYKNTLFDVKLEQPAVNGSYAIDTARLGTAILKELGDRHLLDLSSIPPFSLDTTSIKAKPDEYGHAAKTVDVKGSVKVNVRSAAQP